MSSDESVPLDESNTAFRNEENRKARNEENRRALIKHLLLHDQGLASITYDEGCLPLHLVCNYRPLSTVMLLFDANPMALHRRNNHGLTPLGCARDKDNAEVVAFLEAQIELERQARELIQPDENGQLPIHHALRTQDVSLGAIKLMAAANPASLTTADNQGFTPLHYACKLVHADIAAFLIKANQDSLKAETSHGMLPLHLACLGGNCNVVNSIL